MEQKVTLCLLELFWFAFFPPFPSLNSTEGGGQAELLLRGNKGHICSFASGAWKTISQASKTAFGLEIMRCFRKWTWSSLSQSFCFQAFWVPLLRVCKLSCFNNDGRSTFFNESWDVLMLADSRTWGVHFKILWHLERGGGRTCKPLNFKPYFCWVTILCSRNLKDCKSRNIRIPCWWSQYLSWQLARSPRDALNFLYSLAYF